MGFGVADDSQWCDCRRTPVWGGLETEDQLDPPVVMPKLGAFSHVAERTGQDLGGGN